MATYESVAVLTRLTLVVVVVQVLTAPESIQCLGNLSDTNESL